MTKESLKKRHLLYRLSVFFPVQLLLLHIRRSYLLLIFWFVLFGVSGGWFFKSIGVEYLFITPEYLGYVAPMSYFIMGLVLALFVMAFHICSYIFYSYRFSFLATLSRPLWVFSINNSIIPIVFYIYYSVEIANGLSQEGFNTWRILLSLGYLYFGSILGITVVLTYFFSTIKSLPIKKIPSPLGKPLKQIFRADKRISVDSANDKERVKTYLKNFVKVRPSRDSEHYSDEQKLETLQQHHVSAAIFFVLIFVMLIALSWFSGNPYLEIPAGASVVLLLTMYLMIIGALYSRFKTWTISLFIMLFLGWNYLSGWPPFEKISQAYGIDYNKTADYSIAHLEEITSPKTIASDKENMLKVLENWRANFPKNEKPKMIFLNSSGGGMRSALWSLAVLQKLDSATAGQFSQNVFLISGSSGGMIGSAYYRELSHQRKLGRINNINSRIFYNKMGQDMLNAIGFSMVVNDLFLSFKKVEIENVAYRYDRGRAFEERLLKNTDYIFDKKLLEYEKLEQNAEMPLMVLTPTVINEGRRLIISPLGLSFLARNKSKFVNNPSYEIDGIEFSKFFADNRAGDLRFVSALRMSATFPYITPLVSLPCNPRIELIDAGAKDNDGFDLSMRFLFEFKEWIAENTSGVVVVKLLADRAPTFEMNETPYKTKLDAVFKPINGVFRSFSNLQEFAYAEELSVAESWMDFDFKVEKFALLNNKDNIALSWHLTELERNNIYERAASPAFKIRLKEASRSFLSQNPADSTLLTLPESVLEN